MVQCNKTACGIFFFCTFYFVFKAIFTEYNTDENEAEISEVDIWLQEHNLSEYKSLLKKHGKYF